MVRTLVGTALAFVLFVGTAAAEEFKAKIVSVDTKGNFITVKVGDAKKNTALKIDKETKLLDPDGKELSEGIKNDMLKADAEVVVTAEGKGKKRMIKEVKLAKK
jgi:hypothetical protein